MQSNKDNVKISRYFMCDAPEKKTLQRTSGEQRLLWNSLHCFVFIKLIALTLTDGGNYMK